MNPHNICDWGLTKRLEGMKSYFDAIVEYAEQIIPALKVEPAAKRVKLR